MEAINGLKQQFQQACHQIQILNERIYWMIKRYRTAKKEGKLHFAYSLKLQMDGLEEARDLFFAYAQSKFDAVQQLKADTEREDEQDSDGVLDVHF